MARRWSLFTVGTTSGTSASMRWFLALLKTAKSCRTNASSSYGPGRATRQREKGREPGGSGATSHAYKHACAGTGEPTDVAGDAAVEPREDDVAIRESLWRARQDRQVGDGRRQVGRQQPAPHGCPVRLPLCALTADGAHTRPVSWAEEERAGWGSRPVPPSSPGAEGHDGEPRVAVKQLDEALPDRARRAEHAHAHHPLRTPSLHVEHSRTLASSGMGPAALSRSPPVTPASLPATLLRTCLCALCQYKGGLGGGEPADQGGRVVRQHSVAMATLKSGPQTRQG